MDLINLRRKLPLVGTIGSPAKGGSRYPFSPFPIGWYALGLAADLGPGKHLSGTFFGRELVVFRTESGKVCAMDAFCPHMGAHMGYGGRIEGETLRCPFHGFCFDTQGACKSTPYEGPPPPTARGRVYPVREQGDVLLAYYDPSGAAPTWFPPNPSGAGWSPYSTKLWIVRSHPQETTENSVDFGHLSEVHGYRKVEMLSDLRTEGPYLYARYAMSRKSPFAAADKLLRANFDVHVHGLGFSFVEVHVPEFALESRLFVYSTPTDGEKIRLLICLSVKELEAPERFSRVLRVMPRELATTIVRTMAFRSVVNDVQQDFDIWENKRYVHPAALAAGDGPIGRYRRWCRQFYPDLQAEPEEAA